jgi:hypothetical protein
MDTVIIIAMSQNVSLTEETVTTALQAVLLIGSEIDTAI